MIGPFARWREGRRADVYTVHEPPDPPTGALDRAERIVFLKDGFSWAAFLLGPFWLAYRRAWIALAAYAGVLLIASAGLSLLGAPPVWSTLVTLALGVFVGLEGTALRRDALARQGWQELGTVSGRNLAECERRYFETWLAQQDTPAAHAGVTPRAGAQQPRIGAVLTEWSRSHFGAWRDRVRTRTE